MPEQHRARAVTDDGPRGVAGRTAPSAPTLLAMRVTSWFPMKVWGRRLRALLRPDGANPRDSYAVWGFYGLVDAACLHWLARGCPADEGLPLVDAALGALEGALGISGAAVHGNEVGR